MNFKATMKLNTLLPLLTIVLFASCSRQYTCDDFKTGTYVFDDETFKHVTITRTETEQIEQSVEPGKEYRDVYEIIWDGSCSYSLVFKETDNLDRLPFSKYDTITSRIIEIVDDGYRFETAVFDIKPTGYLIKKD